MSRCMLIACALAAGILFADPAAAERGKALNEALLKRGLRLALASVRIGRLAQQRAVSPQVRALGAQIANTNTEVARNLRALARQNGTNVSGLISTADRRTERILQQTPGIAFDQSFLARAASLQAENLQIIQRQLLPEPTDFTPASAITVVTGGAVSSAVSSAGSNISTGAAAGSTAVQQLATVSVPTLVQDLNGTQQVAEILTLALIGLQNGQCGFIVTETGSASSIGTGASTTSVTTAAAVNETTTTGTSGTTGGSTVGTVSTGTGGSALITGLTGTTTGTTGTTIITGGATTGTGTNGTTVITGGTTDTTGNAVITGGVTSGTTTGTTVFSPATGIVSPATGSAVLIPAGTPELPNTTAGVSTTPASSGANYQSPGG